MSSAMQGDLEASKSGAVLLTKDNNMGLKAQANNLKALSPAHFPAAQPHLHKQLLSISSDTSPVKHSQPPQDSPGSSPRRPRGLFMEPPEALASLTASAPNSFSKQVQLAEASGSGQVGEGSHSCLPWPGNPTDNSSSSAAISRMLSARNRSPPVDQVTQQQQQQQQQQLPPDQRSQSQQSQQALQQALQDYQQQQQQQQEAVIHGSLFRLQESPMVHPGMVTGSHGYPRAPSTTATHLLPGTGPVGMQQPQLGSQSGIPVGVVSMNGSMQHQQGGFPGLSCLCVHAMLFVSCSMPFVPVALQSSICAICCHSVGFVVPLPAVHELCGWLHLPFNCLDFHWSYPVTAVPTMHLHPAQLEGVACLCQNQSQQCIIPQLNSVPSTGTDFCNVM
jgi:hypothetical protein